MLFRSEVYQKELIEDSCSDFGQTFSNTDENSSIGELANELRHRSCSRTYRTLKAIYDAGKQKDDLNAEPSRMYQVQTLGLTSRPEVCNRLHGFAVVAKCLSIIERRQD